MRSSLNGTAIARQAVPDDVRSPVSESTMGRFGLIGQSESLREAVRCAERVARSPLTTVLLSGETGTGKELFARGIHQAGSSAAEPFVAINCSAIPQQLLESELFGHEKGAFTDARQSKPGLIEYARTGTLFLDELGEMPLGLQPKLLRVLEDRRYRRLGGHEERRVDCRVIAGTNVNLEAAVAQGRFREDLFYRLNVMRIDLPALRDRLDDVIEIAHHFLAEIASRGKGEAKTLGAGAVDALRHHRWPGNIRELKNVVERATMLATGSVIHASDLRIQRREAVVPITESGPAVGHISIPIDGKSLDEIEHEAIRLTMIITAGNLSAAARILGVSRPTLTRKMKESGVTRRSLLASS
jgi:DNA-binding NtrC family response regulator